MFLNREGEGSEGMESTSGEEESETREDVLETLVRENRRMEAHVAELQLELTRSGQRLSSLENSLGEARREADQALVLETGRLRTALQQENCSAISLLRQQNDKLDSDLNSIRLRYEKLQTIYDETEKAFSESVEQHGSIMSENETLKSENGTLVHKLGLIAKQLASIKGSALMRNKVLRTQLRKSNLVAVETGFCESHSERDEQDAVSADYIQQTMSNIEHLNEEYSEMHLRLQEAELHKSLALLQNQNDKYKDKIEQQTSVIVQLESLLEQLKEEHCEGCNKIEEILEENEQLKKGFEEMLTEIEYLRDELKTKNATIKQQECKIARLLHDTQKNEQTVHELEDKLKTIQNEIGKKTSKITLLEANNNEQQVKLRQSEQTMARLEQEKADINRKLEGARERVTQLELHFKQLKHTLDEAERCRQLTEQQNREQSDLLHLKLEQLDTENNALRNTVQDSSCKCESLANELQSLSFYHDNQMAAKDARFQELKQDNQRMRNELAQLKDSFQDKEQLYQKVLADLEMNKRLTQDAQQTCEENAEMKTAIDILRSILNDSLEGIIVNNENFVETVDLSKVASEIYIKLAPSLPTERISNGKKSSTNVNYNGKNKKFSHVSRIPTLIKRNSMKTSFLHGEDAQVQTSSWYRTNSLPNLTDNYSSIENEDLQLLYSICSWEPTLKEAKRLHSELQIVTNRLTAERETGGKPELSLDCQRLVQELQQQVAELQVQCCQQHSLHSELTALKRNVSLIADMQQQILALKDELHSERINRIHEFEIAKLKKEQELSELRKKLKDEFLAGRETLMSQLAAAEQALQIKSSEERKLRDRCTELSREVAHKQEQRRNKLAQLCTTVEPSPPMLACICAVPPQRELAGVLRAQLHSSVTKHRLRADSLPIIRSRSDEELPKKYLIN